MLVESAATHRSPLTAWDLDLVDLDFDIPLDRLDHQRLSRPMDALLQKHPDATTESSHPPAIH